MNKKFLIIALMALPLVAMDSTGGRTEEPSVFEFVENLFNETRDKDELNEYLQRFEFYRNNSYYMHKDGTPPTKEKLVLLINLAVKKFKRATQESIGVYAPRLVGKPIKQFIANLFDIVAGNKNPWFRSSHIHKYGMYRKKRFFNGWMRQYCLPDGTVFFAQPENEGWTKTGALLTAGAVIGAGVAAHHYRKQIGEQVGKFDTWAQQNKYYKNAKDYATPYATGAGESVGGMYESAGKWAAGAKESARGLWNSMTGKERRDYLLAEQNRDYNQAVQQENSYAAQKRKTEERFKRYQ